MSFDLFFADDTPKPDGHLGMGNASMDQLCFVLTFFDLLTDEQPDDAEASEEYLTWQSPGAGIPSYKFSLNDGCLVTETECERVVRRLDVVDDAALATIAASAVLSARLDEAAADETDERPLTDRIDRPTDADVAEMTAFVRRFADFCRRAANHGGFTVN